MFIKQRIERTLSRLSALCVSVRKSDCRRLLNSQPERRQERFEVNMRQTQPAGCCQRRPCFFFVSERCLLYHCTVCASSVTDKFGQRG